MFLLALVAFLALPACAEKIEILRDLYGTPHIFAATAEGAAFASGYLQAADRPDQIRAHLGHAPLAEVPSSLRAILAAFCAGIQSAGGPMARPESIAGFAARLAPRGITIVIPAERTAAHYPIFILDPLEEFVDSSYPVLISTTGYRWAGAAPVGLPFPLVGHGMETALGPGEISPGPAMLEQVWARQHGNSVPSAVANPSPQAESATRALADFNSGVTIYDALRIATSPDVYHAEIWQRRIARADSDSPFARMITGWSRRADFDSAPALGFYLFKMALGAPDSSAIDPPAALSDDRVRAALRKAQERLEAQFRFQATFGTLFQVAGQPATGGTISEAGMATPRALRYEKRDSLMVALNGQTVTQVVELARPLPKSYMLVPPSADAGQFARGQMRPTYFGDRKELEKHVTERRIMNFP